METKHTKGVWRIGLRNKLAVVTDKNDSTHPTVCECNNQTIPNQEAEANAKLIAAAPELLEVLIEVEKWASEFGMGSIQYEKVINAINKATGK